MANGQGKSLSELEQEAAATRSDLARTVDSLQKRVSPHAIKEDFKEYARDTGHELFRNLDRRARENPLQTVAVAAGLAYPLWRFLINIPAPVLMVGAGLALTRSGGSQGISRSSRTTSDTAGRLADTIKQGAQQVSDTATQMAADAAGTARSQFEGVTTRAADAVSSSTRAAGEMASEAAAGASAAVSSAYRESAQLASQSVDQFSEAVERTKDSVVEAIERHPLVAGGLGLLVGALIASSLPVTPAENRLFGETSDELKERARDTLSEGVQIAKTKAEEVYEAAVSQAGESGLNSERGREAVNEVGEMATDNLIAGERSKSKG
jgi:ElaB/YqjD/DUF883 family membrane-anchored ribosome-binding protein